MWLRLRKPADSSPDVAQRKIAEVAKVDHGHRDHVVNLDSVGLAAAIADTHAGPWGDHSVQSFGGAPLLKLEHPLKLEFRRTQRAPEVASS